MYKKTILKNGVRLVTVPLKNVKTVTVLILVGTGSKYETKENNGISHFLEHMFFKGTKKRPNTLAIAETLDRIGGEYNAFTSKEMTGYYAKVEAKHLDLALDWVSDIFLNSKIEAKEIEKERRVIIEEINMYQDTPMRQIASLWEEVLYQNQPAGRNILGEKETVSRLTRNKFLDYLKKHYLAKNTVMVVAGHLGEYQKPKVENYFKNAKKGKASPKKKVIEKQKTPKVLIQYKKTDQSHFCLGVRTYNTFNKNKYALSLLGIILGGNMSSRLWIAVREKEGLGYYINTVRQAYSDSGYLMTRAGVDNKRIETAIKIILEEYKRITTEKVGSAELKKAKDYIRGSMTLGLEASDEIAYFLGEQEIINNSILTPEEKFAKIEAVTAEDIQRVARDIFKPEKLNLALIGPFKDKERFKKLLRI